MARSRPTARAVPRDGLESTDSWPGKDLGLPADGPRSVGRLGRRVVALVIDGALTDLVAFLFRVWTPTAPSHGVNWGIVAIYFVLQVGFIALLSGSFGQICVGLRVVPIRGGYVGVVRPIVRTLLLCLVVPALIWDRDQRGLHDRAAGTVLVRR
ncbi:RDD family protein [Curtobacterium ammoniigenes]|uniref:RDD family protein n=1 Tax=Curtobacterium ammoniigenes TaxID=395387 RepID=UPI0008302109|nr:RDD family protein [Curtobacterium ammoniigenes]